MPRTQYMRQNIVKNRPLNFSDLLFLLQNFITDHVVKVILKRLLEII